MHLIHCYIVSDWLSLRALINQNSIHVRAKNYWHVRDVNNCVKVSSSILNFVIQVSEKKWRIWNRLLQTDKFRRITNRENYQITNRKNYQIIESMTPLQKLLENQSYNYAKLFLAIRHWVARAFRIEKSIKVGPTRMQRVLLSFRVESLESWVYESKVQSWELRNLIQFPRV